MATRKRAQLTFGPSNDEPALVQIEMRAAELVAAFECDEPVRSYMFDDELLGWLVAVPIEDDYSVPRWEVGASAAWIATHHTLPDRFGDPPTAKPSPIVVGIDSDEHGTAVQINGICDPPPLLAPDEAETLAGQLRAAAAVARRTRPDEAAGRGYLAIAGALAPELPDGKAIAGAPEPELPHGNATEARDPAATRGDEGREGWPAPLGSSQDLASYPGSIDRSRPCVAR